VNNSQDVTWDDVERLTKLLSKKISRSSKKFSSISTISRGGLVPARLLADYMGVDMILVDKNKIPSDSLFVDDIYDSGKTFKKIIQKVINPSTFVYATLFARQGTKYPKQLVYAQKTKDVEYVVFPWDALEYKRSRNF
jgi:hypoxanthine phosphoribosyltransferase